MRSNVPSTSGLLGAAVDPSSLGPDEVEKDEIQSQLVRLLASASFKNSKRHTQFLSFLVEKSLSGKASEIKERLIGIEVFDRPHDYDVTADPIVRGAAVELRKRIAQYYADPHHANELRIDLPLGSYAPVFYWTSQGHKPEPDVAVIVPSTRETEDTADPAADHGQRSLSEQHAGRSARTSAVVVGCAIVFVAIAAIFASLYFMAHSAQRSLDAFWGPLMDESDSITVCVGDLNYIFKAPPFGGQLQLPESAENPLNPNAGAALLQVGRILGARGKRSTLRLADLTQLNDLRQQPVIFIGGMNNPWTQRILAGLRFRLTNGDYSMVIDGKNPALNSWRIDLRAPVSSIGRDYSLVTRMNDPLTGEPIVILCGLGPFGTAAASEFVSNPSYFSEFSRQAPKGWESQNIQIVLETTVVNGRVSVPRVVAEQIF